MKIKFNDNMQQKISGKSFLLLIICVFAFTIEGYSLELLTSFENKSELKNFKATNGVDISQSSVFPALGAYSLKTVFPEDGGTVAVNTFSTGNWDLHLRDEVLLVFVWTYKPTDINLSIEDSLGNSYSRIFQLKRGVNHLQLELSRVKKVNLKQIESVGFQSSQADTLYFDYLALDHYQPALANHGRWDIDYSNKIKTPHISWGNPLAGRPIKTYSISPIADGRGIIELAERLDIDHKVTSIGRSAGLNKWGFGAFYGRRNMNNQEFGHPFSLAFDYIAEDLLWGPKYDVIIWPGLHKWEDYPEEIRSSILKRVKNGTGLVLLYPKEGNQFSQEDLLAISPIKYTDSVLYKFDHIDREASWSHIDRTKWTKTKPNYITRGVSLKAFPWRHMGVLPYQNTDGQVLIRTAKGNPVLAVGKYGKGRVVAMACPEWGLIPRVDNPWGTGLHYAYWEYMWSLVARSVVWAAKREPTTTINKVTRTDGTLMVDLSHVPDGASLKLKVRDSYGNLEKETTITLSNRQTQVKIELGQGLHGGDHIASIRLVGGKGVYDWYSLKFHTSQVIKIGLIHLKDSMLSVGKEVQADISLKGSRRFKGNLIVGLYDNYGRLISANTCNISPKQKSYNVELNSNGVKSNLGKLDVILQGKDGQQVAHKTKELFFILPREWDDYDITMYNFGPNPVPGTWPAIDSQLQKLDVTTLAAYTEANSKLANYKIIAQTRIPGVEFKGSRPEYYKSIKKEYLKTRNKMLLIQKPDLQDPTYLDTVAVQLSRMISKWRKFSPAAYYIYEEASLTNHGDALDISFSKESLNAFRSWLKEKYVTLQALNQEWGTNFTQWKDVIPDDSYEAQKRGNYASWADHRTFMEDSWARLFKYVQKITHQNDPGGIVQLSGSQESNPFTGYDYSKLDKYIGQMNSYNIDNQLFYHHDFNPALKLSGGAGYGHLGKGVLYGYYRNLFLGEYGGAYVFWQYSALRPDLELSKSGLYVKQGFDEMCGEGIGKLVGSFAPENENRIAIEYSMPSVHASWIVDGYITPGLNYHANGKTYGQFRKNRSGWVNILQDAGLGFDFISYNSIANGGLITKGYKVLILPMNLALSDREVRHIKHFVKQGGTVIADALPGIMDGHAKFRERRALAEVFGIEPATYAQKETATPSHETNLQLKGAKYLIKEDGIPELLYHKYGAGHAYLLNYFLDKYPKEKENGNSATSLTKIEKLLNKANIRSKIYLTDLTGQPTKNISKYTYTTIHGDTRLLGLLPEKNSTDQAIKIHLDKRTNIYNIREGKYIGKDSTFRLKVEPEVPILLGLVEGEINDINVNAPSESRLGERIDISFHISGTDLFNLNSGAHVEVINPKGKKMRIYRDNSRIINSSGSFHFKTALNEPSGKWIIQIKEVISGTIEQVPISIH